MAQTDTSSTRRPGVPSEAEERSVSELTPPVPEQTAESIKEDVESTKERAKEGRA